MLASTLSLLALLGAAAAQNVVPLLIPDTDTQNFVGEVIGISPTATTYVIQCAPGTNSSDCGFNGPFTLTEGPSTVEFTVTEAAPADFTAALSCVLTGSPITQAMCTQTLGGSDASGIGSTTLQLNSTDITLFAVSITGTAKGVGAGSQSAASITASGSAATTMSGATTGAMTASMGMSSTPTGSASGSSTASPTAKSGASQKVVGSVVGLPLAFGIVMGML